MSRLIFPLAIALFAAASHDARGDAPATPAANPVMDSTMVQMPLKGKEPMPIGMKKEGMMKEDVKKEYMKKEPMIEEIMEKEEMKK
ncbi:MAG: hypothetical protein ACREUV_00180 [Burkholderiales bacterium]